MAGIGFQLRKIFEKDTYADTLRGAIMAATIAGGPIFFSIICLILLGIFATFISGQEMGLFLVTLVYVFAFSLISTGIIQLLITRYLSDLIYINEIDRILPSFCAVLALTIIFQLVIGLPFILFWNIDFSYKLTALILFITVGCNWQLLVFMSALKSYRITFIAFIVGLCTGFFLALFLGERFGLTGFLHGYTIGQIILMFVMLARMFVEFKSAVKPTFQFLKYLNKVPLLILIGFCYNAGIWIDKIIFWFSPEGQEVHSLLYAFRDYDTATFFAFLTTIPSYTYFLVKVETDFYGHFRGFFHAILSKQPYMQIKSQKNNIAISVKESLAGLIKIQGVVTLLCLLFSKEIAVFFGIPALGTMILEKTLIAVFLQMLLLTVMIFLLYFDIRKEVAIVTGVFFLANMGLTLLTLKLGYVFYGYGYLFACLIALIVGYAFLNRHLHRLEYHTFVSQPLAG